MADEFGQVPIDFVLLDTSGEIIFDRNSDFLLGVTKKSGGWYTPLIFPGTQTCPSDGFILWVDEAAIERRLPANYLVNAVADNLGIQIFGPVLITGESDADGNVTSVPDRLCGKIRELKSSMESAD